MRVPSISVICWYAANSEPQTANTEENIRHVCYCHSYSYSYSYCYSYCYCYCYCYSIAT